MTARRLARALAIAATIAASTAGLKSHPAGGARAVQAGDAQPPVFHTEANYVRVDVYPTKDGVPVQDLTKDDFEVLEDKVPQNVATFEHIVIRPAGPQETRREPNSVGESRDMLNDPRARVFVIFLDVGHVEIGGSHNIRQALVDALEHIVGPDDLVAVMTPDMSPDDLTFARRTTTLEGMLTRHWNWGERDRLNPIDPAEQKYETCYGVAQASPVTAAMIARHREEQTLNAFGRLVGYLREVREERTAVLAVTDGWLLYRRDDTLANAASTAPPPITMTPGTGKLTIGDRNNPTGASMTDCDADRLRLAYLDDEAEFRRILDQANRSNVSFYPMDPRGLAVFDTSIESNVSLAADAAMLRTRLDSLRTLAEATDGIAIVNNNDLSAGVRRVVSDLSSYYLLGYYSSGKMDGKFHSIAVRVKRPGVQVRARRGYLAPTLAEANARTAAATAAPAPLTAEEVEAKAVEAAVAPLGGFARELPLRVQLAAGWTPDHRSVVWAVGEIGAAEAHGASWQSGGVADVLLSQTGGGTMAEAHATLPVGARTFQVALAPAAPLAPGVYDVRIRVHGAGGAGIPINEVAHVTLAAAPAATGVVLIRRGISTGNKEVPTADRRFRRNERLRAEVPAPGATTVVARLLDRLGKPLAVPVAAAVRDEPDGSRWVTADLTLAPLAPGEYVIELTGAADAKTLVAFQVVP